MSEKKSLMSHYQWDGDTLIANVTSGMTDEDGRLVGGLIENHFKTDLSEFRRWLSLKDSRYSGALDHVVVILPDGRECEVRDVAKFQEMAMSLYNKETVYDGCRVVVWENTATGDTSYAWFGGEINPDPYTSEDE